MATLADVLRIQTKQSILMAPASPTDPPTRQLQGFRTPPTLQIALRNNTSSSRVYASITGLAMNNNYAVWLLQSDGISFYYPTNPKINQQPLEADCAIALGAPGTTRIITVPQLVGARIWFSKDTPLSFKRNHGDFGVGLVEPSVTNPADPNFYLSWAFVEFTYNDFQLFANITYVDFVSIPIALRLDSEGGATQNVLGLPEDGLDSVCRQLKEQHATDGAGWDRLVVPTPGGQSNLRALSPNNGIVLDGALFDSYWQPYVDAVWDKYYNDTLYVNTQVQWGEVEGRVSDDGETLDFDGIGYFPQPSSRDVFSCSTGAFADYEGDSNTVAEMANIGARLAAAFNRSTLLGNDEQPDGEAVPTYYRENITNHYARILHGLNLDGRGYAFPYDDVAPSGNVAADQMGAVASERPRLLTVLIGGGNRATRIGPRDTAKRPRQLVSGRRGDRGGQSVRVKRALSGLTPAEPPADRRAPLPLPLPLPHADMDSDVEKGGYRHSVLTSQRLLDNRPGRADITFFGHVAPVSTGSQLQQWLRSILQGQALSRARPLARAVIRGVGEMLSLPLRSLSGRVAALVCLWMLYSVSGLLSNIEKQLASARDGAAYAG